MPNNTEEKVIVPGENLVVKGIPSIPFSLAERVGRYTEFRMATFQSWHPTKREMLITTRFGDTSQVHLLITPGGARTQITFYPDTVRGATYDPKSADFFVFSKDIGGNEFAQNFRYDFATGDTTLLTDGKSQNSLGIWSNSGDEMVYRSTRRTGKDSDLWVIDPRNPEADRCIIELQGGGWYPLDWSPDDRQVLLMEYVSINETYLWLVDVAAGTEELITPRNADSQIAYLGGKFSKTRLGIYVTTDRDWEFQRLAYFDLHTRELTYLTSHINWDVDQFDLSSDGTQIAFVTNEDGIGKLHLLDTNTGIEKPMPALPPGQVVRAKWHDNNRDLAFELVSAQSPVDIYSLDIETGVVDQWTKSETGGLNTSAFREPELIRWNSFDDRVISGFLYRPPARFTGKRPVMIVIHGGPESQFRPIYLGRTNYHLNELGVALFYPNIRGSSGYGKTFLTLDNGMRREDSYRDIETLLDWIATQPDLDAERIMVTGGSYGGHMTLAVATRYDDRIRCSLDIVGMSNLVTFLENTEPYRQDLRRAEYGDERDPEMRAFLERIAPLNHADKITKPLFIVQGKNDPRVPYTEAEQMVAILQGNNTPVWFLMANDEGHGFIKKKNADFQFYATLLFVQEFLLG